MTGPCFMLVSVYLILVQLYLYYKIKTSGQWALVAPGKVMKHLQDFIFNAFVRDIFTGDYSVDFII